MSKPMKIIFTIVDYSYQETLTGLYQKLDIPITLVLHGHGMADSAILDYLGFGENKKIIAISFLKTHRTKQLFYTLAEALKLDKPGRGISFSIPISSMSTFLASLLQFDEGKNMKAMKEEAHLMAYQNELIMAVVTKGLFLEVKTAANAAGAKGGTLIHALGLGSEEAQKFLGISIQPEKDIILIVVRKEERNKVMDAIAAVAGIQTKGKGILFSLPVDCAIGLSSQTLPQHLENPLLSND